METSIRSEIIAQMRLVAEEQNKRLAPLTDQMPLLHSGLDSLCLAVIVARLEDVLGVDPFTASADSEFPVTLGDFVRLYEMARPAISQDICQSRVSEPRETDVPTPSARNFPADATGLD